jgi:hypothetical protein
MGVFPQREPALPTLSSLSAFVHTPHLNWTQCHGELDEQNHTYPDDIERVHFIKDDVVFWV